jgi:hypothetical protein
VVAETHGCSDAATAGEPSHAFDCFHHFVHRLLVRGLWVWLERAKCFSRRCQLCCYPIPTFC